MACGCKKNKTSIPKKNKVAVSTTTAGTQTPVSNTIKSMPIVSTTTIKKAIKQ